uniref:Cysteine-rich protein 2-like n=2 Tax=Sinocyclocheilus TaxID=75365 RepID=A0A671MUF3_9TELE
LLQSSVSHDPSEIILISEKVSSLGKNWHRFCLKCERCSKILSPGGHAEHDGLPYCHKPCYGTLFGPKGMYNKMLLIGFSFESFWAFSASCSLCDVYSCTGNKGLNQGSFSDI